MQSVSTLYRRLLADPEHVRETKARIAGVEYGQDNLYSCSTSGNLFPEVKAGGCISREMELCIRQIAPIPRMAETALFSRLVCGEEVSEWIPRGVYYTDTRATDEVTGLMTLHGFDAMMKTEAVWLDPSMNAGEWPMSQTAAAADIAAKIGVSVDPRSAIKPDYRVEYPNDLTMREVLSYIAACHTGNWSMSGDGKLLLMPLSGMPQETNLLVDDEDGGVILFGEVRIIV